jgi:hypothetical protein
MSGPRPEAVVWRMIQGSMATQALRVAVELGIADRLVDGARSVDELAVEVGVHADALHRVLRALAGEGVFEETEPRLFANTPPSDVLRSGDPAAWPDFVHFFGGAWYDAMAELPVAVRTGDEAFTEVFGNDWWRWLESHPEEAARFDRAMAGEAAGRVDRLARLEWRDETVVDVGGGNGAVLVELLRRYPRLRGIVFDLPHVAEGARSLVSRAGLADRCDVVAGTFFGDLPESGDAYVLSGVLHDWDDDDAAEILRRLRAAAPEHARIVILDGVIEPGNEPDETKWLDLLMLVLNRGRERTEDEWRSLLDRAGLRLERVDGGLLEAVCR